MTIIYFVRHVKAENRKNTQRARITPQGLKEAKLLSKRLQKHHIDVFYSSSYQRGIRTAEIIADPHHSEIEKNSDFSEVKFQKRILVKKRVSLGSYKELKHLYSQPEMTQIENLVKAQKRAVRLVKDILKEHPNQTVLIVSHGNIIKSIMLAILKLPITHFNQFIILHGSVSAIVGDSIDNMKVLSYNDTSHLETLKKSDSLATLTPRRKTKFSKL